MDAVAAATSTTTSASAAASKAAGSALETGADFETFLTLLTTQLKNQDPLNPQDSTEFVAQLAQFSSVEQAIKSNTTLDKILSALGGEGPAQLGPWIDARVEAPSALAYDGKTPLELRVDPAPGATASNLVVQTAAGVTVATVPLEPTDTEFTWNGDGGTAGDIAAGTYVFKVERSAGDEALETEIARGFSSVTEARFGDNGVELTLSSGSMILATDVTAIRSGEGG